MNKFFFSTELNQIQYFIEIINKTIVDCKILRPIENRAGFNEQICNSS